MRNLIDFAIRTEYERVKSLGDHLAVIGSTIDWERFRFIELLLYKNKTSRGGRPNIDVVFMIKVLILQHWYNLSDPEVEKQIADRISFRIFLGTTETVPDFSTVWLFRERLIENGVYELIWKELQKQIDEKGYVIQGGTIQDATFILSDPGKKKKSDQQGGKEKKGQDVAATNTIQIQDFDKELLDISNNIKTSIIDPKKSNGDTINEGSWAKKGSKSYFGYKAHIMIDVKNHLIRTFEMTTASVHDSQIDLGIEGLPNYRDKGYYGAESCGYPATMKKATRGHKLETKDILRNKRISKKRSHIERCFGFMKRAHNAGHVCVTTIKRTAIKFMMNSMIYNLEQLKYLANKKPA